MSRDIVPLGLRMQPELKDKIEGAARASGRSMNAEIVSRLEASFEPSQEAGALRTEVQLLRDLLKSRDDALRSANGVLGLTIMVYNDALSRLPPSVRKSAAIVELLENSAQFQHTEDMAWHLKQVAAKYADPQALAEAQKIERDENPKPVLSKARPRKALR